LNLAEDALLRGMARKRILFIQHAGALGGSAYSLLYTLRALRPLGFEGEVALIRPGSAVRALYEEEGFPTYDAPLIDILAHTTGGWARWANARSVVQLVRQVLHWRRSGRETLRLLRETKPDLVHLNSAVLAPSAFALRRAKVPFVWHIRECPPNQGLRTAFLRQQMIAARWVVFISQHDQEQWVRGQHGAVIPNFVDWDAVRAAPTREQARRAVGVGPDRPVVLYVGGLSSIKGFRVILRAAALILRRRPNVVFLMPSAKPLLAERGLKRNLQSALAKFGLGTRGQMLVRYIKNKGMESSVLLLPFATNILDYLAACDVLVFPSVKPHFARPAIEAAAMSRPVVGSDIGGVRELIVPKVTGLLVPPGDSNALAAAIVQMLDNPSSAVTMGCQARNRAHALYDAQVNVCDIARIYGKALGGAAAASE